MNKKYSSSQENKTNFVRWSALRLILYSIDKTSRLRLGVDPRQRYGRVIDRLYRYVCHCVRFDCSNAKYTHFRHYCVQIQCVRKMLRDKVATDLR